MVDIFTIHSGLKCERKTEIGKNIRVQVCTRSKMHAQMKTEESPVLLMGLLAHGDNSADVSYRGCSR